MMAVVWMMVGAVLIDLFDQFERRYAVDLMRYQVISKRWVSWGLLDPGRSASWVRYFALRLPSYTWAYRGATDEYDWGQRVLLWAADRGWQMQVLFE